MAQEGDYLYCIDNAAVQETPDIQTTTRVVQVFSGLHPVLPVGPRVELCVDPIDYNTGVANTIQRAELVGIYKALQIDHASPDLLICTDSLSSMPCST